MDTIFSSSSFAAVPTRKWSFMDRLNNLNDLYTQRQAMRNFDASRLQDLGLNQDQVEAELAKPIWTQL